MPAPRSPRRARLAVLASVALAFTGLQFFAPPAAQAASGTVVISEIFGANGAGNLYNQDYVELHNPSGSPVSLAGMSVQYRAATSTTGASSSVNLSGTMPPGSYYLVGGAAVAGGTSIPAPDGNNNLMNLSGTGGVVILANTTSLVTNAQIGAGPSITGTPGSNALIQDLVGYGTTPDRYETNRAPAPGNTSVIKRTAADGDNNATEFTASGTGDPTPAPPGPLTLTNPGTQNSVIGTPVSFTPTASDGVPPYTWSATGLPDGLSINTSTGEISGTPTTANTYNTQVTVTDAATPTAATDNESFTWNVTASVVITPIKDIQGTGTTTPLSSSVTTEGEVTASYATGGLNGFYIQTPGADTANASDAIFVYGGTSGFTTYPAIGASVRVTGTPNEFSGQTQLTSTDADVAVIADLPGTVTPKTQIPGTNCALPGTACLTGAALDTAREVAEGEAFQPTAPWVLTDVYDGAPYYSAGSNGSSMFGEMGVAADSSKPLVAPTELYDNLDANVANRKNYNDAHRIILDDASSLNYTTAANTGLPFPWLTPTFVPRVGAAVTFPAPVIFTFSFNAWRIEPTSQVVGAPSGTQPQFAQTRAAEAAPQNVGGEVKLATFNVLNFFPTTGNEFVGMGGGRTCTYFTDRAGNQITNNSCNPNGPRGAANAANLTRQRDKIVAAINTANADIVSLEELENSIFYGKPRDFAIGELVTALNAASTPGKWAFVASPAPANLPAQADQDVIRNGFIYQPANVTTVGAARVLTGQSSGTQTWANAREPLAQAFKKVGTSNSQAFAVIVNHFKSKGSGVDDGTGQGNANPDRVAQANSLVTFANQFKLDRGLNKVFLVGDFNAYTFEDPIQVLTGAGYAVVDSTTDPEEESYNFDGQVGSLDHVLANAPALADVSGADVWQINAAESVYYEYSRYNYNITDLYTAGPFKSSDHNPEIVGINVDEPATRNIQILGTNDFHGRLQNDTTAATAGAAVLAGAVKQLRSANPDTAFVAAGDLIGASTFESFIAKDKPTIDSLNEAGLDVSAAGNHEFDQGYNDLVNRVMQPYDATTNPYGGANWQYIAANLRKNSDNSHALAPTFTQNYGNVQVGFVGAVTEHLPELVSPAGISTINVTDIVTEVNAAANTLKAGGADVIVLLVHEGAPNTNCATMDDDPTSDFGSIINGVNVNIDAIVSGHTHLAYDCSFPVAAWTGRPVTDRPVVSAGQYGMALNKLVFTVNTTTGQVQAKTQALLPLKVGTTGSTFNYPSDPATATIVSNAVANASVLGAVPLGQIGGPFFRGKLADGTTENRGAESTLGNLVAEVQRWNTRGAESGAAQIAFMNPGGLRQDMVGSGTGAFPRTLTYKQAADVQPFANTLVNMDLTGAQIKTVLEQQWQPTGAARPFLRLGISKGFTYTFDDSKPVGSRITGMWLNGAPIVPATLYSVTVNSFLAAGGDNFLELNNGAGKQDTGKTDLQGMVDYMAAFGTSPDVVPVDYQQTGVGITFAPGEPASYKPGDHVRFDVSSWSMTNALDAKDTEVVVKAGATTLGTFPLNNAAQASLPGFDTVGKASVDVVVPDDATPSSLSLTLTGASTGTTTTVTVPIIKGGSAVSAPNRTIQYGQTASVPVTVTGTGATPSGTVELLDGSTSLGTATLAGGSGTVTVPRLALLPGTHTITVRYLGDSSHDPVESTMTLTVEQSASSVDATVVPKKPRVGQKVKVQIAVHGDNGVAPTGQVTVIIKGGTAFTVTLVNGTATVNIGKFDKKGQKLVTVQYLGSVGLDVSQTMVAFEVKKKKR